MTCVIAVKKAVRMLTGCALLLVLTYCMTGCSQEKLQKICYNGFEPDSNAVPYVQVEVRYDKSGGIHIECHTDCKEPVTISVYHDKKASDPPIF